MAFYIPVKIFLIHGLPLSFHPPRNTGVTLIFYMKLGNDVTTYSCERSDSAVSSFILPQAGHTAGNLKDKAKKKLQSIYTKIHESNKMDNSETKILCILLQN